MRRSTRNHDPEGPAPNAEPSLAQLQQQIQTLQETVQQQAECIQTLQNANNQNNTANTVQTPSLSSSFKAPPVPMFTGKPSDRTSEKVRSFFYSIRKYGTLCNYSPEKMMALAESHLQNRAATWITRLEQDGKKPQTLEELRTAMSDEFVPANEIAQPRVQLMEMKRDDFKKLEDFISKFEDLVIICGTPINEAYICFFNSLPRSMKGKFTEKFPTSQPLDRYGNPNMQAALDYARTLELSMKMSGTSQKYQQDNKRFGGGRRNKSANANGENNLENSEMANKDKDPDAVSWGPAKKGEGRLYRSSDRCCICGKKPFSDPNHPCRKDIEKRRQNRHSKN